MADAGDGGQMVHEHVADDSEPSHRSGFACRTDGQNCGVPVDLHSRALDFATLPLRSIDGPRLAHDAAVGSVQHDSYGRDDFGRAPRLGLNMLWEAIGFYSLAFFLLFFAFQTISVPNPIHAALYLVLTMIG